MYLLAQLPAMLTLSPWGEQRGDCASALWGLCERPEEHTWARLMCVLVSSPAPLLQCVEDRQICPSLAGFQFTKWDSESHNEVWSAFGLIRALGIFPLLHGFSWVAQDYFCPVGTKTVASFNQENKQYFPWHVCGVGWGDSVLWRGRTLTPASEL